MKKNPTSPKNTLNHDRAFERKAHRLYAVAAAALLALTVMISPAYAAGGDPLAVINNLSDFIFSLIRAVGMILLGFGVLQVGMSLKTHSTNPHKARHYPQKPSETHKSPS